MLAASSSCWIWHGKGTRGSPPGDAAPTPNPSPVSPHPHPISPSLAAGDGAGWATGQRGRGELAHPHPLGAPSPGSSGGAGGGGSPLSPRCSTVGLPAGFPVIAAAGTELAGPAPPRRKGGGRGPAAAALPVAARHHPAPGWGCGPPEGRVVGGWCGHREGARHREGVTNGNRIPRGAGTAPRLSLSSVWALLSEFWADLCGARGWAR